MTCVYIGVSNLLTGEVVEWMGMGVATMLVIEMNRYIYILNQHVDVLA